MKNPLVTIILPTYNGARFISRAMENVISQSYINWELLIIVDGSTDATADIVRSYAIKDSRIELIENEKNLGIQKTLNKGLSLAQGKYIARIDDDDRWSVTDKLEQQVHFLEAHHEYCLIGTGAIVSSENGEELFRYYVPESDTDIRQTLLSKNCFVHSSVIFRKDAAIQCGGYDESQEKRHIEDYDLWLKLGTYGLVANLHMHGVTLTDRAGSITSTNRVIQARRALAEMKVFRKKYPRFLKGYFVSSMRLVFFCVYRYIPFKEYLTPLIKAIYKRA